MTVRLVVQVAEQVQAVQIQEVTPLVQLLQQVKADFDPVAKVEYEPRMEGRQMIMILAPK